MTIAFILLMPCLAAVQDATPSVTLRLKAYEQYLTSVQDVEFVSEAVWIGKADQSAAAFLAAAREKERKRNPDEAPVWQAPPPPASDRVVWTDVIYYKPLSLRINHRSYDDRRSDKIFHNKQYSQIFHDLKRIEIATGGKSDFSGLVSPNPLHAVGLLLLESRDESLVTLLNAPAPKVGGEAEGGPFRVTIGPGIPKRYRPKQTNEEYKVELDFGGSGREYPDRIRFQYSKSNAIVVENKEHTSVINGATGRSMAFPAQTTLEDGAGITTWNVSRIRVNQGMPRTTFEPNVAEGYTIHRTGQAPPTIKSNDRRDPRRAADAQAREDSELLNRDDPTPDRAKYADYAKIAVPALLLAVAIALTVYNFRRHR